MHKNIYAESAKEGSGFGFLRKNQGKKVAPARGQSKRLDGEEGRQGGDWEEGKNPAIKFQTNGPPSNNCSTSGPREEANGIKIDGVNTGVDSGGVERR